MGPREKDKIISMIEEYESKGLCANCKGNGFIDSYGDDGLNDTLCPRCGGSGKFGEESINIKRGK